VPSIIIPTPPVLPIDTFSLNIFNKIISKISRLLGKTRGRIRGPMGKIHGTVAVGAKPR
jgi:hypothetical protein